MKKTVEKPRKQMAMKVATRVAPKVVVEKPKNYLDISPRNNRRTAAPKVDTTPIDDTPPSPIKTISVPAPRRTTRKPVVVEKPEEVGKERRSDLPDIPRESRRTRREAVVENKEPHDIDSSRFVRMLNRANAVVGVIPNYVPERMTEGYRFIDGEPTIPTRSGPENSVPGMKKIKARDYSHPEGLFDAILLWRDAMLEDIDDMPEEKLVGRSYEGIIRRLTSILDEPQTFGHIYGAKPTGALARALGYGG